MSLPTGKVIVAGCTHGGLSVIRSLGKHGLTIIAMTYNPGEHGLSSRYVNEKVICPHPKNEIAFINFLLKNAQKWSGALIVETNDYYATALSKHKDVLKEHYRLVVPDWEVAQVFIEKDQTYRLAEKCGVLHPRVFHPSSLEELEVIIDQIQFPTMVKPVRSHEFHAEFNTKLFIAYNADELRQAFRKPFSAHIPVVVSEIIPGTDYKSLERVSMYIDRYGNICSEMYNLKLRQAPPMFGINRVSQTVQSLPEVRMQTLKLLRAVNFKGHAGVEFKRDPRDNKLKLIEINIRLLADTQLAIACGIDTPWMIYQDIVEDNQFKVASYNNTYFIHGLTDMIFIAKDIYRFQHFGRLIEPYIARHKTFAYLSLSDPKPFISEACSRLWNFVNKASQTIFHKGLKMPYIIR